MPKSSFRVKERKIKAVGPTPGRGVKHTPITTPKVPLNEVVKRVVGRNRTFRFNRSSHLRVKNLEVGNIKDSQELFIIRMDFITMASEVMVMDEADGFEGWMYILNRQQAKKIDLSDYECHVFGQDLGKETRRRRGKPLELKGLQVNERTSKDGYVRGARH